MRLRAFLYNQDTHLAMTAPKEPNPKRQAPPKSQAPIFKTRGTIFWSLMIGVSLEFGIWDLGFGVLGTDDLAHTIRAISVSHG
jgi:hypothetical protein